MFFQPKYKLLTVGLLVILLFACQEDDPEIIPVLDFTSPSLSSVLRPPDTVLISGTVEYPGDFEMEISLLNSDLVPVAQKVVLSLNGPKANFSLNYEVLSADLPTGDYFIRAKINNTSFYREINLVQSDLEKVGYLILTQSGVNSIDVYWYSDGQLEMKRTVQSDYAGSAVSSMDDVLVVAGAFQSGLNAFSIPEVSPLWTVNKETGFGLPDFSSVFYGGNRFYAGRRDGRLNAYDSNGSEVLDTYTFSQHYAAQGVVADEKLFVELVPQPGTSAGIQLGVAAQDNGFGLQQSLVGHDIRAMVPMGINRLYTFWNETGVGQFESYNYAQNGFESFFTLPSKVVNDACAIDGSRVVLAMADGIYIHNYTNNNFGRIIPLNSPYQVEYDPIDGELAAAVNQEVRVYGLNGQFRYAIPVNDSIFAFHNIYSR